jgi:hypothetical protein
VRQTLGSLQLRTVAMDGNGDEAAMTAAWMEKHRQMYQRATRHPFTVSIRDGTVDLSAFKRWMVSPLSSGPKLFPVNDVGVQLNIFQQTDWGVCLS